MVALHPRGFKITFMKKYLFLFLVLFCKVMLSNVVVYFNYGLFNTPSNKPYLETYLTITGNSVKYTPVDGGYQASVNILYTIKKGDDMIKASKYNLLSPITHDTLNLPSFIDNQRFQLPNGKYTLELEVFDNAMPEPKTTYKGELNILFNRDKKIASSSIQILESFLKSNTPGPISKNGFDMIPYNINYYPEQQNSLKFYFETYNLDTVFSPNQKFLYTYFIEDNETLKKQMGLTGFQKQYASKVNPILAQFDISKLASGNYNLVIEVRDSLNILQFEKKWFFQRNNSTVQKKLTTDDEQIKSIEDFFNHFQSMDSLKMFMECLWPISTTKEREWEQNQIVAKNPSAMRNFMVDFWKKESGDTIDPLVIWVNYYKEVQETIALLKCGKQKGYYTDRGRVYLQYGKPNQRSQVNSTPNSYPYEVWQYYRLYDRTTGQIQTNKKFIFANFGIADDCYQLIHSDAKGELYDDKWRFRLISRLQKSKNVDDTAPMDTYGNNMDDLFNNPR